MCEVDHTLQFSTLGADELAILYTDEYFELAYCDDNTKSDKSKEAPYKCSPIWTKWLPLVIPQECDMPALT